MLLCNPNQLDGGVARLDSSRGLPVHMLTSTL